jgi:predicted XRE-type DNA-binding protein
MARPKSDVFLRFLQKVLEVESGCCEWQSTLDRSGYGKFYYEGRQAPAHRVSYRLFVGDPGEMHVLHRCDNRRCVNPDHLFLGTRQDNVADMDAKHRRGTKCKLTVAQAAEILSMLDQRFSQREVAERFGIHQTAVSRIKLSKTTHFKE